MCGTKVESEKLEDLVFLQQLPKTTVVTALPLPNRKKMNTLRKILWPRDTSWPFWFATTSMFMNVFSQCEYLKAIIMYALNSHPKLEALARASQPAKLVSSS